MGRVRGCAWRLVRGRAAAALAAAEGTRGGARRAEPDHRVARRCDDGGERVSDRRAGTGARRAPAAGAAAPPDAARPPRDPRIPAARLHPLPMASRQPPGAAAVALPRRAPRRSRSRLDDRPALSFRRAGDGCGIPRRAGAAARRRSPNAAGVAAAARLLGRLSPQQPGAAGRSRAAAQCPRRHPAHARHPSLDAAGGNQLELLEPAVLLGPPAPEHAVRCAAGVRNDRGPGVPATGRGHARAVADAPVSRGSAAAASSRRSSSAYIGLSTRRVTNFSIAPPIPPRSVITVLIVTTASSARAPESTVNVVTESLPPTFLSTSTRPGSGSVTSALNAVVRPSTVTSNVMIVPAPTPPFSTLRLLNCFGTMRGCPV